MTTPNDKPRWKSVAYWPEGCCPAIGNVSDDLHYSKEAADAVCWLLHQNGFGGDGKYFPLRTEVIDLEAPPAPVATERRLYVKQPNGECWMSEPLTPRAETDFRAKAKQLDNEVSETPWPGPVATERPTPETDALIEDDGLIVLTMTSKRLRDKARSLERQRDELAERLAASLIAVRYETLYKETRDELAAVNQAAERMANEADAEVKGLLAELAPLRELVGVDARAASALTDIHHWTKMQDLADSALRLTADLTAARAELRILQFQSRCNDTDMPDAELVAALHDELLDITDDIDSPGSGTILSKVQAMKDVFPERDRARAELQEARRERDEALCRIMCQTCGQSIVTCNCASLGSVTIDLEAGSVVSDQPKRCPVAELRAELAALREERDKLAKWSQTCRVQFEKANVAADVAGRQEREERKLRQQAESDRDALAKALEIAERALESARGDVAFSSIDEAIREIAAIRGGKQEGEG